jgi:ribosomal protein S18 acetylase RimI-like enzyme
MSEDELVEAVRRACLSAAREAHEDGGLRGLCAEGRWELACDAIRALDLAALRRGSPEEPRSAASVAPAKVPERGHFASIRRLGPEDAEAWFELRLRALREHPRAFLSSEAEELERGVATVAERLGAPASEAFVLAAQAGDGLVGTVGVVRERRLKVRHRAGLWGMYVVPEQRGRGLGRALMVEAIGLAREMDGVERLCLSVDAANVAARELYLALGFGAWGTEPDAFRAAGESVADLHMVLSLR